ncbi:MAG TPA: hypothetical protein PLD59_00910 [Tepidisphaeraceae bacterium]|nr:hypothetical protein [Tepidisphaeraceae bacterium]
MLTRVIAAGLMLAGWCNAQVPDEPLAPVGPLPLADPAPGRPQRYELGDTFTSEAAGISFRGPGNCIELKRSNSEQLVQFVNEEMKWSMSVGRVLLSKPMRLIASDGPQGRRIPGLLESTIEQIKVDAPGAEILREDFVNIGDAEVGMIVVRSTVGMDTRLTQRALVRGSDLVYYNFTFISPAPRQGPLENDLETQKVVDLFGRVIDTVRVMDQSRLKEEQNERLYRTRAVLLNFSEARLRDALAPEQWWRLIRDGKDIGYSYVVEEVANDLPRRGVPLDAVRGTEGVRIGVRSRTYPESGAQVDSESWLYASFDRRNEVWSSTGLIEQKDGTRESFGEFGTADREVRRVIDPRLAPGELLPDGTADANQPPVRPTEVYMLTVTRNSKTMRGQTLERQLPPFYLPQALNHLLPRILPYHEPKTYLFATWIGDQGEVVKRYIDVGAEQYFTLDGRRQRAIPIADRIGVEGAVTTHYVSPEGRYLGSQNEASKILILTTDKPTLEKIWKDANLTRPAEIEGK